MLDWIRRIAFTGIVIAVMVTMGINTLVREIGGGNPHILSPYFLAQKTEALGRLGLHSLTHIMSNHEETCASIAQRVAREVNVPESFILAVAKTESALRPHSISRAGAMGIMQLMPATARQYKVGDPFDTESSIRGGAHFLAWLWKRYRGDRKRVAAAYNAGPGRVPRKGALRRLPKETQHYIRAVLKNEKRVLARASRKTNAKR